MVLIGRRKINPNQLRSGKIAPAKPGARHAAPGNGCVGEIAIFEFGMVEFRVAENGLFKPCLFQMRGCKTGKVKTGPAEVGLRTNTPPEPRIVQTGIFKTG